MVEGGIFRAGAVACAVDRPDGPVTLGIRPEQIEFADPASPGAMTLTVDVKEAIEPDTLLIFQSGSGVGDHAEDAGAIAMRSRPVRR